MDGEGNASSGRWGFHLLPFGILKSFPSVDTTRGIGQVYHICSPGNNDSVRLETQKVRIGPKAKKSDVLIYIPGAQEFETNLHKISHRFFQLFGFPVFSNGCVSFTTMLTHYLCLFNPSSIT